MYWFHSLLVAASRDPESHEAQLLRSFTFTVIPTINPDGYVYSHEHSRLWRKNRQDTGSPICRGERLDSIEPHPVSLTRPGIDLNSNWGYRWRKAKASPCSDAYSGDHAIQAYEVSAMADFLALTNSSRPGKTRRVKAFVDLHSYGQLCELSIPRRDQRSFQSCSRSPTRAMISRQTQRCSWRLDSASPRP